MANTDEKNIHEGHRWRLVSVAARAGLANLSDIQIMELVLFYIFPRGDQNPLAHRLLDKFGTLADVLEADINDLTAVPGVGARAATLLRLMPEIFHVFTCCKLNQKIVLDSMSGIFDFCEMLLRLSKVEELYIVGLNASFQLVGKRKLASGSINMVGIERYTIASFLNTYRPIFVLLAHNHPGGKATPSAQDFTATENMKSLFRELGVSFIDHIVIGSDGVYSIEKKAMQREYVAIS